MELASRHYKTAEFCLYELLPISQKKKNTSNDFASTRLLVPLEILLSVSLSVFNIFAPRFSGERRLLKQKL